MKASMTLLVNRIRLSCDASVEEAFSVAKRRLRAIGVPTDAVQYSLYRRSVDARRKDDIHFVCTVAVRGHFPSLSDDLLKKHDIAMHKDAPMSVSYGHERLSAPPVVVGSGPCGLFCALLLAEHGYRPVVLERGGDIRERRAAVARFNSHRILDPTTNIQFGAGGAGTFSDGKLLTRIADPMISYVLDRFVSFGAPEDILYMAKPHIGTDILSEVVERMLSRIEALGGRICFHTQYLSHDASSGRITSVLTNRGQIPCGALILAIGHSARDTYRTLMVEGVSMEAKSFSVGMRIEHLAEDIDRAMYGDMAGHPALGHAEYALSYNTKERGVYTFCMCPGGTVVAAASEEGGVVVNGMSEHSRDGRNSNSAVLCSIFKEDYGSTPEDAIAFQYSIERAAYAAGGGSYAVPLTTVGDFLNDRQGSAPTRILPTYMNGDAYTLTTPDSYLPKVVCRSIRAALLDFDRKIHGFAAEDALLSGAETRTSAPLRLLRHADTRLALGYSNLYPAGEGAGYAGGITSASVDGLRTAQALMARYAPLQG